MLVHQDIAAKLTLTRLATAPVLVAEIGKLTGQNLEVSPTMRSEVLMVCVEGADTTEVLGRLANAASATWVPMENGFRLVPDNAARGIEASAERARRLQAIRASIQKKATAAETPGNPGNPFGNNRSVEAFVPMLDLAVLAAMEPGDRIVFASSPTQAQRPLRGDASTPIKAWVAAHNKNATVYGESFSQLPEGIAAMMEGPLGARFKQMGRPVVGAPAKVVVVATRGGFPFFGDVGSGIQLQARLYDKDGAVMLEESGMLDDDPSAALLARMTAKPDAKAKAGTPIVYSKAAESLIGLSSFGVTGAAGMAAVGFGNLPKPNADLKALLSRPDLNDPLALVPGEGLVALAKARRKPLVACLPDSAYPGVLRDAAPRTVEELETGLKSGPMRVVPDAGYLVLKPSEPASARLYRVDRGALATIIRAAADHESPTLDEKAEFAVRTPDPSRNPVSSALLGLFAPGVVDPVSGQSGWSGLRLYAALSSAQRDGLTKGARIPFSTLNPGAKDALATMLYGAGGGVEIEGKESSDATDPVSLGMRMALGASNESARQEPTQIVPLGLPSGGYLQASIATEPIIRPTAGEDARPGVMSLDEIATMRLLKASAIGEQMGSRIPMPDGGRLGSRAVWSLRGYVASATYVGVRLNDDRTPKNGASVVFANLPEDLRAALAQKEERLRKGPLGSILSMAGMKP